MLTSKLQVVFMSYDEPWADTFYSDLLEKRPDAKRIHGVKGLDACHKAAAEEAGDDFFITVDADTRVDASFFDFDIPDDLLHPAIRLDWPSRNTVNGLTYGNGSLKCWPREMVRNMKTHEAAPVGVSSVDHDVGKGTGSNPDSISVQFPDCHSITSPAETAFHAFRCGYREGFRMGSSKDPAQRGRGFDAHLAASNMQRLKVWCSVGAHRPNGDWVIYGARLGLLRAQTSEMPRSHLNSFDWFMSLWTEIILPRVEGTGGECRYLGDSWAPDRLAEESARLCDRIVADLGFGIANATPRSSALLETALGKSVSPSLADSLGTMYLHGKGVQKDATAAQRYFKIGTLLNQSNAYNNLARMHHKALGVDQDIEAAQDYYEVAIALGNEFAPSHLSKLLGEFVEKSDERDSRMIALRALSKDRGFVDSGGKARPTGTSN